jgi:hypothetical protein
MTSRPDDVAAHLAEYPESVIILSKSGVKLGIVNGATLPDPKGLLEGAGKRPKYVVLSAPSDLRRPGLAPLLKSAATAVAARGK